MCLLKRARLLCACMVIANLALAGIAHAQTAGASSPSLYDDIVGLDGLPARLSGPAATIYNAGHGYPWTAGIIPVEFDAAISEVRRTAFYASCARWTEVAAVQCVPRTAAHDRYLQVSLPSTSTCNSSVGMSTNPGGGLSGRINLGEGCWGPREIVHEIGHTLGLFHEHQRPDRDSFIWIDTRTTTIAGAYTREVWGRRSLGTYDFRSVMHYDNLGIGSAYIMPKTGYEQFQAWLGTGDPTRPVRFWPTTLDAAAIRMLYHPAAYVGPPDVIRYDDLQTCTCEMRLVLTHGALLTQVQTLDESQIAQASLSFTTAPAEARIKYRWPNDNTRWQQTKLRLTLNDGSQTSTVDIPLVEYLNGEAPPAPPPPSAPQLTASTSNTAVSLSWTPGDGTPPQGYSIAAGTAPQASDIGVFPVGLNQAFSQGIPAGRRFYARIIATNRFGSATSNEVSFGIGADPPATPKLIPTQVTSNPIVLNWSAGSGVATQRFVLHAGTAPGLSNVGVFEMGLATSVSAMAPANLPLHVRVVAHNTAGGTASNEISFTVAGPPAPAAPVMQSPQVNGSTVRLAWSNVAGATYTLIARMTPTGAPVLSAPVGATTLLTVPNVGRGTYYVTVVAIAAGRASVESNQVVVTVE